MKEGQNIKGVKEKTRNMEMVVVVVVTVGYKLSVYH